MKNSDTLLEKYNQPVPRYTSYPPANFFHSIEPKEFLAAVEASNGASDNHVSFYIHIPFCRQLCHFCACNSYPMARPDRIEAYVEALHKEIDLIATHLTPGRKISQIHYGGGSPTAIPIHYLRELNEHLLSLMETIDRPEIAIECHPGYLDEHAWAELIDCRFSRYSLGVQDFDEEVLRIVHREPPLLPVSEIVSMLHDAGTTVNMDLLFGLPHQTVESFARSVRMAAEIHPERIVTFSYGHVPWVHKRQLILERAGLPEPEEKQAMYRRAADILHGEGYRSIGMDHFVLPSDELSIALDEGRLRRNFQGYCTLRTTAQVYALGVTGISQLGTAYAQNGRDITEYIDTLSAGRLYTERGYLLSPREQIVREVIETLMCNYRLRWSEVAERLGITAEETMQAVVYDRDKLHEMAADGLINLTPEGIELPIGSPYVRYVAASLDPLMQQTDKRFSKPV